jgi:hypothetical protein
MQLHVNTESDQVAHLTTFPGIIYLPAIAIQ